ncbi:TetR/AcrR family transcriptional regulator [Kibdelosporangium philippinense]|uniref:TetR/AcrR family transcriptional regulator n=1 Tax=Kibdelosporangium philippinense TaxID=211113 RepID=A0ABS8ZW90_9PSEU|nr:TetR/AcrR family transcriptional regulator [Kibdelosporangium philippinense]MCE7010856.1 TetR/AcrR family transcriptional regulator [Kibdelosporangium philippinense]
MGRASKAEAAQHREDVVHATAKLLRERGSASISVQDAMAAAGLTHGGFYKHFASKDELMGIAATEAFEDVLNQLVHLAEDPDKPHARAQLVRKYLSTQHRDSPGTGCANAALAGDSAQAESQSPLRKSYVEGMNKTLSFFTELESGADARRQAIVDLATLVGALTLARATGRTALSKEILETVKDSLQ